MNLLPQKPPKPGTVEFHVARLRRFLGLVVAYEHDRRYPLIGHALRATFGDLVYLGAEADARAVLRSTSHVDQVRALVAMWEQKRHTQADQS